MKRLVPILAILASLAAAAPVGAQPATGSSASCSGYLASYANPNNGFVIHQLEKPAAEALGVPMGTLQSSFAQQHNGSLAACIP
jgi:hypothetical protein